MDRDGRPRIPLLPNISKAPDPESQAAMRRGRAAEQQWQSRELRHQQEWDKNRSEKALKKQDSAHQWTEVKYTGRKTHTKPHWPQQVKLERWYELLEADSEVELDETTHGSTMQYTQLDCSPYPGIYKFTSSGRMKRDMSEKVREKPNGGGRGGSNRVKGKVNGSRMKGRMNEVTPPLPWPI